ncbi:MAG: dihydroorotase [Acutalibacteraceae bacterium]
MNYILKNARIFTFEHFKKANIFIRDGLVFDISEDSCFYDDAIVVDCDKYCIFPGLVDVHIHLREPGFLYKETIKSGTLAAAHGGYTTVCSMPNLKPVPDSFENLKVQLDIINKDANVKVIPYASITKGQNGKELSDMNELADYVVAFSDDGRGVQSEEIMLEAMKKAKALGKIIVAHCEDNSLLKGGYIHDGEYAKAHNHKGICSESEYGPIARDIELVRKTGCAYHVCHISTKESVELIRQAKKDGLDITCETSPTYLLLNDSMLQEDGRFKMNPPIRSEEDRLALIEGIKDGTIDMIATDHAPHSKEEKSRGLAGSAMGVVALECAFPLLYTYLVKENIITLERLIDLMHYAPKKRFSLKGGLEIGESADLCVYDLEKKTKVDPEKFFSKGKSTPFEGYEIYSECKLTMCKGEIKWQENMTEK